VIVYALVRFFSHPWWKNRGLLVPEQSDGGGRAPARAVNDTACAPPAVASDFPAAVRVVAGLEGRA
jgi:hypothetical protein